MALIDGDGFAEAVGRTRSNITDRVLAVAVRVVNDYAQNAPDEVKNEAIIRLRRLTRFGDQRLRDGPLRGAGAAIVRARDQPRAGVP